MSDISHLSSFRYAVTHRSDPRKVSEVLIDRGFKGGLDGFYTLEVESWNELVAQVMDDEVEFSLHWPGTSVTEKHYEYLVACGRIIEQTRYEVLKLPILELPEAELSEDDDG